MDAIETTTADEMTVRFRRRVIKKAEAMCERAFLIAARHEERADYSIRTVRDHKGRELEVSVPGFWSDNAAMILATKYFRRAGVPDRTVAIPEDGIPNFLWARRAHPTATFGRETSAHQAFHRLAGCWTYWMCRRTAAGRDPLLDETTAQAVYQALLAGLETQMFAPNSPQWFNSGLHWAYGIDAEGLGHFHIDPDSSDIVESTSAYQHPQVHACFISSVEDDLVGEGGIMDLWRQEARIFKGGSGNGANYSRLRSKTEPLSGGGVSSGMMSFLKTGDTSAGAIKSGGTTRRSARMVVVDDDHPEVLDFIRWKAVEEMKVAALVTGSAVNRRHVAEVAKLCAAGQSTKQAIADALVDGVPMGLLQKALDRAACGLATDLPEYDTNWQGAAYETVSGQNANNSISVRDRLRDAIEADGDHNLLTVKSRDVVATMKAREFWRELAVAAWDCADPGLHFRDTINKWHTVPDEGEIRASNPCSEYFHLDNTGCNLASIRLTAFLDKTQEFDWRAFQATSELMGLVLDTSVSMGQYPSRKIAEQTRETRTMGLGHMDIGAMLMRLGVPYDSDEGRQIGAAITSLMTASAYRMSAEIAAVHGPFGCFERNRSHVLRVLGMHEGENTVLQRKAVSLMPKHAAVVMEIGAAAADVWSETMAAARASGLRNAQATLLAPTGTIGFVTDCDTTGVEPDYALMKWKQLAGGGFMQITNQSVEPALRTLGYSDNAIGAIIEHLEQFKGLDDCQLLRDEDRAVFDCATPCGGGARHIHPMGHVRMMAALQPFLSGGISKTVNVPATATVADIEDVHMQAWRMGVKSIAVYRDGSKLSQPLMSLRIKEEIGAASDGGDLQHAVARKDVAVVAETLAAAELARQGRAVRAKESLPGRRTGYTQKISIGHNKIYLRTGEYADGRLGEIFVDMHKEGATFRAFTNCFAIAISIGLQWGVPLEEYVEAFIFTRFEPAGPVQGHDRLKSATSILDVLFRDLAINYLGRDELAHVRVPDETRHTTVDVETAAETGLDKTAAVATPTAAASAPGPADDFRQYTGDQCPNCNGTRVRRAGTCGVCDDCFESVGGCI